MTRTVLYLLAVAALAVLALLLWQGRQNEREATWRADRERLVAEADSARVVARRAVAAADSATARSAAAVRQADSLRGRRPALIVRIDTVTVPAEALPYTAPRDSLIRNLTEENNLLRVALAEEEMAVATLRRAHGRLLGTVDSLAALVNRAPAGRAKLLGLLPLPEVTVGYSAGVDRVRREFFDGPAVHVGWRIAL